MALVLPDPPHVGDYGHVVDTQLIIDALAQLDSRITALPSGTNGTNGTDGLPGPSGAAATITVGGTLMSNPGSNAVVTNSGTAQNAILQFVIPRGADGGPVNIGSAVPLVNGVATVGVAAFASHEDHVHPSDTTRSPLAGSGSIVTVGTITSGVWNAGAVTSSGAVAGTALGGSLLSAANPLMNGTVAVGTATIPSRQDHVHPSDTTRSLLAGSASIVTVGTITSGTWNAGAVTSSGAIAGTALGGSLLSAASPLMNGTVAAGTATIPSRQDHVHPSDTSRSLTAGSSSIVTVGTITSGTWNAGAVTSSGAVTVGGLLSVGPATQQVTVTAGAGNHVAEIGRTDNVASSPSIDFHSGTTGANDYDARIQATGGTAAAGGGTLNFFGASFFVASAISAAPTFYLTNTNTDTAGPGLLLRKLPSDNSLSAGDNLGTIHFRGTDTGGTERIGAYINVQSGNNGATFVPSTMYFVTTNSAGAQTTPLILNGDASVTIGGTATIAGGDLAVTRNTADATAVQLGFNKSRGTVGSPAIITTLDALGDIQFRGYDGAAYQATALIRAASNGAVAAGSVPTSLSFFTSPTNGASIVERMKIDEVGLVTGTGPTFGAWTSYTPVLANWAIGNGTIVGSYCRIGKTVHMKVVITFGSTSTFTGNPTVTLPFTAAGHFPTNTFRIGFIDTSAGTMFMGGTLWGSTTLVSPSAQSTAAGGTVLASSTAPFTWTTSDVMGISGTYEVA